MYGKEINFIKTEHLNIYPLSDGEMEKLIAEEVKTDMKQAYLDMSMKGWDMC